jgi:uncharacterized protein involved in outer membrane biogenesis
LLAVLAPRYRLARPLGRFSLKAGLTGGLDAVALTGITAGIGDISVKGDLAARWDGPRPRVDARLQVNRIVVDRLFGAVAKPKKKPPKRAAKEAPVSRRWSRERIDLSALEALDAKLELAADLLTYKRHQVRRVTLVLALEKGVLDLSRFRGRVLGGAFDLKGRLSGGTSPAMSGNFRLSDARIAEALFDVGPVDVTGGTASAEVAFASAGSSEAALIGALKGTGRLAVRDGIVDGFDLNALSERLKTLNRIEDVLGAADAAMAGGWTRFSRLDGTFRIAKGIVRTDDLHLVGDASEGRGTARIDLPKWRLKSALEFRLVDHPKAPPLGLRLKGPIDNPKRRVDTKALQAYFLERGVGALIRGFTDKDQRGIDPQDPDPSSGKPNVEDTVRGILKMLSQ